MVALIPARAGSRRIPGKNTRLLAGQPLITYTIAAAQQSHVFESIVVCSDDPWVLTIGDGAGVFTWRRAPSADHEPDLLWIQAYDPQADCFAILRPTSPFRSAADIQHAFKLFMRTPCSSLRAMRAARENPYKMWWPDGHGSLVRPFAPNRRADGTPYHSLPSQDTMGTLYVQTGGLEMAWTRCLHETPPTITGDAVVPFHLEGPAALDLNTDDDWRRAEALITSGEAILPPVDLAGVPSPPAA